jgi:hypothetical protein
MTTKGLPESVQHVRKVQRADEAYPASSVRCEGLFGRPIMQLCMVSLNVCCKEARLFLVGGPCSSTREKSPCFFHG